MRFFRYFFVFISFMGLSANPGNARAMPPVCSPSGTSSCSSMIPSDWTFVGMTCDWYGTAYSEGEAVQRIIDTSFKSSCSVSPSGHSWLGAPQYMGGCSTYMQYPIYYGGFETSNVKTYTFDYVYHNQKYNGHCENNGSVELKVRRDRTIGCPTGKQAVYDNNGKFYCVANNWTPTKKCDPCKGATGPGDTATGNYTQTESDISGGGPDSLSLGRTYNSFPADRTEATSMFGAGQRTAFDSNVRFEPATDPALVSAFVTRPDGRVFTFNLVGTSFVPDADVNDKLERTETGWTYTTRDRTVETFDAAGKLLAVATSHGYVRTLAYNQAGQVESVSDSFGHQLRFSYGINNRVASVTDAQDQVTSYEYDDKANLTRVTYPDNTGKIYHYENGSYPHSLTGTSLVDATGNTQRQSTNVYGWYGRVEKTELAGGVEKRNHTFDSYLQTTVSDAAGTKEVYKFEYNLGVKNLVSKTNLWDNKSMIQKFDARNNMICRQDENGRVTTWTFNATNQKTSMTEGRTGTCSAPVTTSATRTTNYQYLSADTDLPTVIEAPSVAAGQVKRTTISYSGLLPGVISQTGFTPGGTAVSREVSLTYNNQGKVTSIDGPRTDISDITELSYYNCATGGGCGQIASVRNAMGHTTTFDSYDTAGRLLQMTDPNGLVTRYRYDLRGRLVTVSSTPPAGETRVTTYTYDLAGNIAGVGYPDGRSLAYSYDAARKLLEVTDNLGNRVAYGYDSRGNRNQTNTYDASGTLVRAISEIYDARNRVSQINAGGSITSQVYDAVGNLTRVVDANTNAGGGSAGTSNDYDALDRLMKSVDLLAGNTAYEYDVNSRIKSVKAANGATTSYEYDDLGNLLKETSPDRGVTTYAYDTAGNIISTVDARGTEVTYTYDALNRVIQADYPGSSDDVIYAYDSGINCGLGIGRLCRVVDASGSSEYTYDSFGNMLSHRQINGNKTFTTSYGYDAGNRVVSVAYPGGRTVGYQRDALGRVSSVVMQGGTSATTLIGAIAYRPDGLVSQASFGNGLSEVRNYDTQGRLREQYVGAADTRLYSYDANGNLTNLQSLPQVGAYQFDALNRLTQENVTTQGSAVSAWSYDANGNRKSDTTGGYSYAAASNRLGSAPSGSIVIDAAGNTTSDGTHTYSYNAAGQLATVSGGVSYSYNAYRQRVHKAYSSQLTTYHYDLAGHLIAETDANGQVIRDYVWADGRPVAQIDAGEVVTWLHTDHLDTPRIGTSSNGTVVWRWDGSAFGNSAASGTRTVNLRYPGQYYDTETGLHYNWNRYYDPKLGRYITSDPIGLDGGINTYNYAASNPYRFVDLDGLGFISPAPCIPDDKCPRPSNPTTYKPGDSTIKPVPNLEISICRLQRCLGMTLEVSGGSEGVPYHSGAGHPSGRAVDFGCTRNPALCTLPRDAVIDCALKSGFTHGKFHGPHPHWHLQVGPGDVPRLGQ